jgi:hypothetical protein
MPPEDGLLDFYMKMLYKSIYAAKEHHKVILYTDELTLPHLHHINVEKRIVDTTEFYFMDDFKIYLLDNISDEEVLVDTDLFLWNPLSMPDGYDLYVDHRENARKWWYTDHYQYFIDGGITNIVPTFNKEVIHAPNIGIFKFKNEELKRSYIELYNVVRKWALDKPVRYPGASVILGQYLLGILLTDKKYKVCYLNKVDSNYYTHYAGKTKFKKNEIDNIVIKFVEKKLV